MSRQKVEVLKNESKGFKLSRMKIEYMHCKFSEDRTGDREGVSLDGVVLPQNNYFKYVGSILQVDGGCEENVNHRIKAGWLKQRSTTVVLCDRKISNKLKEKFYRTAIQPAILYGGEC